MKKDWLKIINSFGLEEQIKHWYTEVRELSQSIDKYDGTEEARQHIISELADNYNFLGQFQMYFDITDIEVKMEQQFKNERTLQLVEGKSKGIEKLKEVKNRKTHRLKKIEKKINELIDIMNNSKEEK